MTAEDTERRISEVYRSYFSGNDILERRADQGVVETPSYIAQKMIVLAAKAYCNRNGRSIEDFVYLDVKWFDPASGAGVFPVAILGFYSKKFTFSTERPPPRIHFNEISSNGIHSTLRAIELFLENHEYTLSDYLESGRLTFFEGDTLERLPEQPELGTSLMTFDLTVGNPPYVRSSRLSHEYRKRLKVLFPSIRSSLADLYIYFIFSAILHSQEGGVVCFITPAAYTKVKHARHLREAAYPLVSYDYFVELDELPIFENAAVHSCISVLSRAKESNEILYSAPDSILKVKDLRKSDFHIRRHVVSGSGTWSFISDEFAEGTVNEKYLPLMRAGFTVYSGVRTGCNQAFLLRESELVKFSDESKRNWIKKVILPRNLKAWKTDKTDDYMILIKNNEVCEDASIIKHLEPFRERLSRRPEVASGKCLWYQLRACSYYDEMNKPKIVFPDLSSEPRFSLVPADYCVIDGSYFIPTDNAALLAFFYSEPAKSYYIQNCASIGNTEASGRFRFKKESIKNMPIPSYIKDNSCLANSIASSVVKEISAGKVPNLSEFEGF